MEYREAKNNFIQSWAQLGSSWGINKTMAQIHALLLVSPKPLTTEDIMEELKVSRGNANMNIRALIDWGLVSKEHQIGERKEFFKADKDIERVARNIARERRKREIEPIVRLVNDLSKTEMPKTNEGKEFKKVTGDIAKFSSKVDGLLDKFSRSDENWFYSTIIKLMK